MGKGEASGIAAAAPAGAPRDGAVVVSWKRLALMLAGLAALSALTALLTVQFLRQRPLDLTGLTSSLSSAFEESLEQNHVPQEAIHRKQTQFQRFQEGGGWYAFDYQIALPPEMPLDGVIQQVGREMRQRGLEVQPEPSSEAMQVLRFAVHGQPFLTAAFAQSAPRLDDFRAESTRIASETYQYIRELGANVTLERGPDEQVDANARWTLSVFTAHFDEYPQLNSLTAGLTKKLERHAANIIVGDGPEEVVRIDVRYRDKVIVRITIEPRRAAADAPAATDAPKAEAHPPVSAKPGEVNQELMPETEGPHTHPDIVAAPLTAPAPEPAPVTAQPATVILPPELPPLEELPLESTVLEEAQLEKPEHGLPAGAAATPGPVKLPRIALIVDDGGYGGERTERLLQLDSRLTLAILPNTPFAQETARRALDKGFEVMLHMPMETYGGAAGSFPGEIRTAMEPDEIQKLTLEAIAQIPGIKGVNNHTGSKFTRDAEKMTEFMKVVKENGYFFIDSITITRSAAYSVAQAMEVPSARRDIFIDNSSSPGLIREQLRALIARAKTNGAAIGIGHFRPNTVRVLEEELPKLEEYGVELVHASELVH